jgi:hypothetical protein
MRMTRAPFSRRYRMVGSEARMRVLSVTAPSFTGQLKSTRTSTRWPSRAAGERDRRERFMVVVGRFDGSRFEGSAASGTRS